MDNCTLKLNCVDIFKPQTHFLHVCQKGSVIFGNLVPVSPL